METMTKVYVVYDKVNDSIAEVEELPLVNIVTYDGSTYRVVNKYEMVDKFMILEELYDAYTPKG